MTTNKLPPPLVLRVAGGKDYVTISINDQGVVRCTSANGNYKVEQIVMARFGEIMADVMEGMTGERPQMETWLIEDHE